MKWIGWMLFAVLARPGNAQRELEFGGWTWRSTAPDTRVEEVLGREALRLRSGVVYLPDLEFRDGVIEFDVATTGHRSFVGAAFRLRREPRVAYEHVYLRPHQSGRFDAVQYTPDIGGIAAWQLYPEYNAAAELPRTAWIHVRLVVSGTRLTAWVGDAGEPALVVDDLRLPAEPGLVGLTSNFPEAAPNLYPTAYSNVRIQVDESAAPAADRAPIERVRGAMESWALSAARGGVAPDEALELDAATLSPLAWDVVSTDARGRLNIAEHRSFPAGFSVAHVHARVVIRSEQAQTKRLDFGFSDRGRVYLNGRLLFAGDNTYRSRSQRYLGVMTVDNDSLYLPLEEGENELLVVLSEAFGGWGLVARIEDRTGIAVAAPDPGGDGRPGRR